MGLIAEHLSRGSQNLGAPVDDLIDWQQRYDGVLVVAYLDGKAVAGISGPWPVSQYALTWWDRPVPSRQLELFDSMEAAQKRVEEWAWRMRTVGLIGRSPANDPIEPESESISPVRPPSWLARLGGWFGAKPATVRRIPRAEFDLMRNPPLHEDALRGIHFAAIE